MARDTGTAGRLRRLGADSGTTALAALGVALALDGSRLCFAALALALAGVVGRAISMRRAGRRVSLLTTQLVQRAMLVAGTSTALALVAPADARLVATGGVLLLAALLYEPYLRAGSQLKVPVVAHLPGADQYPRPADLTLRLLVTDLSATALGAALSVLTGTGAWWLLAGVVVVVPRWQIVKDNQDRAALVKRLPRQIERAVADYAPELALYTSWPGGDGSHQVTMWLPYLQRSGRRCLVVTRSSAAAQALAELVDVPVVEARGPEDLDLLTPPSLKAAFYPNASSGNGLFVRYSQLTHVFLGHGDSDKPTSFNPTHAMYDQLFCAGPAAIRRYAEHGIAIAPEKFVVVGRPQVEGIRPATAAVAAPTTAPGPHPVVLYAPTWRGHVDETSLSSLGVGERVVAELLAVGATVIFRPHPFSASYPDDAAFIRRIQQQLAADRDRSGRAHVWGPEAETQRSVVDCMNASDAMVSDVSSVVSDYLFSGKPYAMVAVTTAAAAFRAAYPVARGAYVVERELGDLATQIRDLLGPDPMAAVRRDLRVDYLGPFPAEGYAGAFVGAVDAVVDAERQQRDSEETADEGAPQERGAGERGAGEQGAGEVVDDGEVATSEESGSGAADEVAERPTPRPGASRARLKRLRRRLAKKRRYHQAGAALAVLALASALNDAPPLLTALLGLASLAAVAWAQQQLFLRRKRWTRLLGESRANRVVLLVAAVVALPHDRLSGSAAAVALVLLTAAVAGEAHVSRAWGRLGLEVRNFTQMRTEVSDPLPRGVLAVAGFVAVLLALVLAALDASGAAALTIPEAVLPTAAVVVFAIFVVVAVRALTRAARVSVAELDLKSVLTDYAPEFAVYWASPVGAEYQFGMWVPYFARIGRPFVVVTRVAETMRELTRALERHGVDAPVIYRPTLRGLEEVIVPSMTTAFYVNNAARNTHFIERRELTHVWLNHGDSEKPACYNPVHAIYDLIFVAGQAGVDRYARHGVHIPTEKFRVVGRPQVETIEQVLPRPAGQPTTILYAPTWQGPYADTRLFSLPVAVPLVTRMLESGVRVVFRAHPLNYQYPHSRAMIKRVNRLLAKHREETGTQHVWGSAAEKAMTVEECFNLSDAMIADVSAVVSDYLHSDKPFAIVSVGRSTDQLLREAPAARAAYVLQEDLSNLDDVLADLLGSDPLAATRRTTRVYYLGDFDRSRYAEGFLQAARTVIDSRSLTERQQAAALSTGE